MLFIDQSLLAAVATKLRNTANLCTSDESGQTSLRQFLTQDFISSPSLYVSTTCFPLKKAHSERNAYREQLHSHSSNVPTLIVPMYPGFGSTQSGKRISLVNGAWRVTQMASFLPRAFSFSHMNVSFTPNQVPGFLVRDGYRFLYNTFRIIVQRQNFYGGYFSHILGRKIQSSMLPSGRTSGRTSLLEIQMPTE